MDLKLAGKVALVTGARRGIGLAIARRLAEEGMALAVAARDEASLRALAEEVEARGGRVLVHAADLSPAAAPGAFAAAALGSFGRIDLLVNNAGITVYRSISNMTDGDMETMWQSGPMATLMCPAFAALMPWR